jgi:hypothetical protein
MGTLWRRREFVQRHAIVKSRNSSNRGCNPAEGTLWAIQALLHMEGEMKLFIIATTSTLLFMLGASAETLQERQACENDAFSVCGAFIPDRNKVFACLANNEDRLSAPCRNVMARYSQPNRRRGEAAHHSQTTGQGEPGTQFTGPLGR